MNNSTGRFTNRDLNIKAVHSNLHQEIIQITEDKLRLVLNQHISTLEDRKSWIAPLGLLSTIVTVFVTSSFKDAYFKAATWEAFFLISGCLSFLWFLQTLNKLRKAKGVDDIINEIKNKSATE